MSGAVALGGFGCAMLQGKQAATRRRAQRSEPIRPTAREGRVDHRVGGRERRQAARALHDGPQSLQGPDGHEDRGQDARREIPRPLQQSQHDPLAKGASGRAARRDPGVPRRLDGPPDFGELQRAEAGEADDSGCATVRPATTSRRRSISRTARPTSSRFIRAARRCRSARTTRGILGCYHWNYIGKCNHRPESAKAPFGCEPGSFGVEGDVKNCKFTTPEGNECKGLLHRLRRRLRHPVTAMKTTTTTTFIAIVALAAAGAAGCIPGKLTKKSTVKVVNATKSTDVCGIRVNGQREPFSVAVGASGDYELGTGAYQLCVPAEVGGPRARRQQHQRRRLRRLQSVQASGDLRVRREGRAKGRAGARLPADEVAEQHRFRRTRRTRAIRG